MSQSPFSKSNPTPPLSFHDILEGISQGRTSDFHQNMRTNFEWNSVVENTTLLNNLFSENLATPHFPSRKAAHSYATNARFHTKPQRETHNPPNSHVNKPLQENVPQPLVNPLWNTLTQAAFKKINAPEVISLKADHGDPLSVQQPLSVFYTMNELKKVYRQRAKITHPDQVTGSHLQFIELKKNYQILMDFLKKID